MTRKERRFLHDLATPLSTLSFLLNSFLERARERPGVESGAIEAMERAMGSVEKIALLLRERRETIIAGEGMTHEQTGTACRG